MISHYTSYIAAILGMHYPTIPHHKRIPITSSAPSHYHACAIREFHRSMYLSYHLTRRMCG